MRSSTWNIVYAKTANAIERYTMKHRNFAQTKKQLMLIWNEAEEFNVEDAMGIALQWRFHNLSFESRKRFGKILLLSGKYYGKRGVYIKDLANPNSWFWADI